MGDETGCRCSETDGGGDCDWCRIHYCEHSDIDRDERCCLECGKDMTEEMAAAAEAYFDAVKHGD